MLQKVKEEDRPQPGAPFSSMRSVQYIGVPGCQCALPECGVPGKHMAPTHGNLFIATSTRTAPPRSGMDPGPGGGDRVAAAGHARRRFWTRESPAAQRPNPNAQLNSNPNRRQPERRNSSQKPGRRQFTNGQLQSRSKDAAVDPCNFPPLLQRSTTSIPALPAVSPQGQTTGHFFPCNYPRVARKGLTGADLPLTSH